MFPCGEGMASMTRSGILWFLAAPLVLAPYPAVFRFAGSTAFVGYALAQWQHSIWYCRAWRTTIKSTIGGIVYGFLTGGTVGWLWPQP